MQSSPHWSTSHPCICKLIDQAEGMVDRGRGGGTSVSVSVATPLSERLFLLHHCKIPHLLLSCALADWGVSAGM